MHSLQHFLYGTSLFLSIISSTSAQSPTFALSTATAGATISQPTFAPDCAASCLKTAIEAQSCAPSDDACLCSFSTQIQELIHDCLANTTICSNQEQEDAFEYYPQHCKDINLAVDSNLPTMIATAVGTAPPRPTAKAPTLSVNTQPGATQASTGTPDSDKNIHAGLQLPAILGIVLVVVLMIVGVAVLMVWSFLRRRQMIRKPRMDLGGEFVEPKPRPSRQKSVESESKDQPPPPIEKDTFGRSLSRSSTLVPPPPVAKNDKRTSEEKRFSARNKALKMLLGADGLRSSFMSSRPSSKKSSLQVPPLNIRKSQQDQLRMSKF